MMLRKNLFIYLIFKLKVEVEVKVEEAINKNKHSLRCFAPLPPACGAPHPKG